MVSIGKTVLYLFAEVKKEKRLVWFDFFKMKAQTFFFSLSLYKDRLVDTQENTSARVQEHGLQERTSSRL